MNTKRKKFSETVRSIGNNLPLAGVASASDPFPQIVRKEENYKF